MTKKRGRKSLLAGASKKEWSDIRGTIIYGSAEWRIIRLRQLIGDGSELPDNFLSARKAQWERIAAEKRYVLLKEIDVLWRDLAAQFERAVLDGDADWFRRQAKAIKDGGLPQRWRFNAKVVYLLEQAMWGPHARRGKKRRLPGGGWMMEGVEDLTLTPKGKFTDAMASDIYNALKKESESPLVVERCQFESKERVKDAIRNLAEQLQFEVRKQH
jgi:hypothetical protein